MKVMLVNGSPHKNGTTNAALGVIAEQLGKDGRRERNFLAGREAHIRLHRLYGLREARQVRH